MNAAYPNPGAILFNLLSRERSHIPPMDLESHLANYLWMGYVSFWEGNISHFFWIGSESMVANLKVEMDTTYPKLQD